MNKFLLIMEDKNRSALLSNLLRSHGNEVVLVSGMNEEGRTKLFSEKPEIIVIDRSNPDISYFLDTKNALGWVEFRQKFFEGYLVGKYPPEIMEITDKTNVKEFRYS